MNENMKDKFMALRPYSGRILGVAIALTIAILFMTIGFFRTLLVVVLAACGYGLGVFFDDPRRFSLWLENVRDRFS